MVCKCGGKLMSCDQVHTPGNKIIRKRKCKECGKFSYSVELIVDYNEKVKRVWNMNHRKAKPKEEVKKI